MNSLIAPVVAAILIVGAIFLVGMPSVRRMASKLNLPLSGNDEAEVIAIRGAWQRMGLLSGGVLVILAVALFVSDLDPYLAPIGYAVAIIAGAAANVGGGAHRRAELLSASESEPKLTGLVRVSWVLSAGIVISSLFAAFELADKAKNWSGMLSLPSAWWPFNIDYRQMITIASVSAFVSLLVFFSQWFLSRRQSIAGVTAKTDSWMRLLASKRIGLAALGGQLMLLGALLPATQVFTLHVFGYDYIVSNGADVVGSLLGCLAFAAGVLVCLCAVLFPLWVGPKRSSQKKEHSGTSPDLNSVSVDLGKSGESSWN